MANLNTTCQKFEILYLKKYIFYAYQDSIYLIKNTVKTLIL